MLETDLAVLLDNADYVFHEAAQAGVRASWGTDFQSYTQNNVLATQRLLESARKTKIRKFVYASSSSVYGDAESYPTTEDVPPKPISPYGVTKLAGEHLHVTAAVGTGPHEATIMGSRPSPLLNVAKGGMDGCGKSRGVIGINQQAVSGRVRDPFTVLGNIRKNRIKARRHRFKERSRCAVRSRQ